ncbi:hypothetical protein AB0D11_47480 [Streptomyces monashensis]|uniref:hypothetical protein n=1 Tax=Streptomyces monashensis TaxID=1678012 RepID=UPI0033DCF3CB
MAALGIRHGSGSGEPGRPEDSLSYAAAGDAAAYCLNGDTVEALECAHPRH